MRTSDHFLLAFFASIGLATLALGWGATAQSAWGRDLPSFVWFGLLSVTAPLTILRWWVVFILNWHDQHAA